MVIFVFGLFFGEYIFWFKVIIIDLEIDNVDFIFIKIVGVNIEVSIVGGYLRLYDWG